ncbi:MAG TPA: hypothetical protein VFB45_22410 [Pseudolabrys sp.]|nr:hypothetical protein [Pseudolabrys sp.]
MEKPKLADIDRSIASARQELRDQHALVLINDGPGRRIDFARLLSHSLRQFRMIEVFRMTALDDAERRVFERDARQVFLSNDARDDG